MTKENYENFKMFYQKNLNDLPDIKAKLLAEILFFFFF